MLYNLIKIPAGIAINIYCRSLKTNDKSPFKKDGPMLIAANHPNSFLDAIILSTLFKRPVHSLVRGDTFKNKNTARILSALHMIPVYRISEGVENLDQNYESFEKCKQIFKSGGIVLIFSEGRCINEWKLRPLKKGTARLATGSWDDGINVTVLPTGINYQSFRSFGKNVVLNFGKPITRENIDQTSGYGNMLNDFNKKLKSELEPLVIQLENEDEAALHESLNLQQQPLKKILLVIPAAMGFITHFPLYFPLKKITLKIAGDIDHYDSVLVGLLFLLYPFYLLAIMLVTFLVTKNVLSFSLLLILPFTAWSYVQLKKQF